VTDWGALFADRRFPELVQEARAALRRRLVASGQDRPITPDEEAVLAAGALLVDGFYDQLGRVGRDLRRPLGELIGIRPSGSRAARARVRFTFDEPVEGPVELPAGLEITCPGLATPFTTAESVRVTPSNSRRSGADPDEPDPRMSLGPTAVVVVAVHGRRIADEPLGAGDGTAGQRFRLHNPPTAVPGCDPVVQTSASDGWTDWLALESPVAGAQQVLFDVARAEIRFPLDVTLAPETLVRIRGYWVGGGAGGNRPAGALTELRSPLPGIRVRVVNIEAARGGRDAENEDDVWQRLPGVLRTGDRAVTAADHEELSRRADPSLARVRCLVGEGGVHVLLIAAPPPGHEQRPAIEDLLPSTDTLTAVTAFLEDRRLLGARMFVEPPAYHGVSVTVTITAEDEVRAAVLDALYAYLHPITGGGGGAGWPFGQAVHRTMIKKLLFAVPGVRDVPRVSLSPVDLASGERGSARPVLELGPSVLPLSVDHRVEIVGD
jgi:hypothetical protein